MQQLKKLFIFTNITISTLFGMDQAPSVQVPTTIKNLPQGLYTYLQNLPHIEKPKSNDISATAYNITRLICSLSNSKQKLIGIESLTNKIETYIKQNKPVQFILLGFPMKSANNEKKVLSPKLDLAELTGLLSLHHLCKEIESIYYPWR